MTENTACCGVLVPVHHRAARGGGGREKGGGGGEEVGRRAYTWLYTEICG